MDMLTTDLPIGLRWDPVRGRLTVLDPVLADRVLRDPHIITGVAHGRSAQRSALPPDDGAPSVPEFFEMWYTVGDRYLAFNTELRKVFTARAVEDFEAAFVRQADRCLAALPECGDLARDYLSPYFTGSTFAMIGVPASEWLHLNKVAKLVNHLFKQQLRGVTEYGARELAAFDTVMRYLKGLTDQLLAGDGEEPFLLAARELSTMDESSWPIAALIGQLLMAGIEPMIVGTAIACTEVWRNPALHAAIREGAVSAGDVTEEVMRQHPPFGSVFRFVHGTCSCLGPELPAGTIVAIDVAAVNLAGTPAADPAAGCPVRAGAVLTFGRGGHYCLGATSARRQVAIGLHRLVVGRPDLAINHAGVRIDTHNNLKEVRALPYALAPRPGPQP